VVVAYFTAGAASGVGATAGNAVAVGAGEGVALAGGGTMLTGTGALISTVVGGAVTAGLTTLATQASVSLINNQGDLGATLKDLGSQESVKALVTAVVTGGVLAGMNFSPTGQPTINGGAQTFTNQLGQNLKAGIARTLVSTAINGGSLEDNLKGAITTAFIDTAAAQGANWIGDMQQAGTLDAFTHKLAHALAGCAAGAARAGKDSCAPGAIGAVIGEISAETYGKKSDTVEFAAMLSGIGVAMAGGDAAQIQLGSGAGANAAANNYLNHAELATRAGQQKACAEGSAAACKVVRELDQKSIDRNTAIREGTLVVTPEQANQILQDMQTTMVGLAGYKTELQSQLDKTSDPQRRAELQNQINQADLNLKQAANLGKDYQYALYQQTRDPKHLQAYAQLNTATNGNELADAMMAGAVGLGPFNKGPGKAAGDKMPDASANTGANGGVNLSRVEVDLANVTKGTPEYNILNVPPPNSQVKLSNGTEFKTNPSGYVDEITYSPSLNQGVRDARQTAAGKEGLPTDVGGHIQACSLGGTCDRFNLFPQDGNFNNSAYKRWENEIKVALNNGDQVGSVTVRFSRTDPASARPDSLVIDYSINGTKMRKSFRNEADQ
jgi:filamentous hemagglutinin